MKALRKSYFRPFRLAGAALLALALLITVGVGCKTWKPIAGRDQETLTRTTKLRTQVLNLMSKAQESYTQHASQVDRVVREARAIHAHQKMRPNNELAVRQWDLLLVDSAQAATKAILPEFFVNWKRDGQLKPVYIDAKKRNVERAFDEIIKLENAKPLATAGSN